MTKHIWERLRLWIFLGLPTIAGFIAHSSSRAAGNILAILFAVILVDAIAESRTDRVQSITRCAGESMVTFIMVAGFGLFVGVMLAHIILGASIPGNSDPGACSYSTHCL